MTCSKKYFVTLCAELFYPIIVVVSCAAILSDAAEDPVQVESLEGISIEAVENLRLPKNNEFGVSLGFFPFDAYYTGFGLSGFYDYRIDRQLMWQVLNASYVFAANTGLASELAKRGSAIEQSVEQLQYVISTVFYYTYARGKLLFLEEYIRSFSSSVLGGLGYLSTNNSDTVHLALGLSFEAAVNDTISWRFEFRNLVAVSGNNFASFTLGAGYNF